MTRPTAEMTHRFRQERNAIHARREAAIAEAGRVYHAAIERINNAAAALEWEAEAAHLARVADADFDGDYELVNSEHRATLARIESNRERAWRAAQAACNAARDAADAERFFTELALRARITMESKP